MGPTIIIAAIILCLCVIGLGFNIFFRKRPFPDGELSTNPEMKKRGISCSREEDLRIWAEKNRPAEYGKVNVTDATKAHPRKRDKAACEGIDCHICDDLGL
jgi:hypothetical protein